MPPIAARCNQRAPPPGLACVRQEYGVWTGGIETAGDKIRLCHSVVQARDQVETAVASLVWNTDSNGVTQAHLSIADRREAEVRLAADLG